MYLSLQGTYRLQINYLSKKIKILGTLSCLLREKQIDLSVYTYYFEVHQL